MNSTFAGLDAHKKEIQVCAVLPDGSEETFDLPNESRAVERMGRKLLRLSGGVLRCCYEAGPCGYTLQRQLRKLGIDCVVVAPSLVPVKPGDRIKTDRRDARKLAKLLRADMLTEVHPPSEEEEAVRDLCRCREDAKKDQARHRHQLIKFLGRHGFAYTAGKHWTQGFDRWLRGLAFENVALKAVLDDYMLILSRCDERLVALDEKLREVAQEDPYREPVGWLRCFHGIDTVTALALVAELHDFRRFTSPRQLMGYLGLVPSEHTSSDRERRGSITKTGNGHVRRFLIETSWQYRHRPTVGRALRERRREQPGWAVAVADKAHQRLHRRYTRLSLRGKPHGVVTTAIARELVGFLWAVLKEGDQAKSAGQGVN